jgi:2-oxoisovalerate dehydrogenase E2 component (dihydrolipoyl transacylase)
MSYKHCSCRTANNYGRTSLSLRGKNGRVTKEDIYRHINEPRSDDVAEVDEPVEPAGSWVARGRQPFEPAALLVARTEKIRGLQRAMVKSMTASALIPQLGLGEEVSMDALWALRQELKPIVEEGGVRLTYLPFFIKAVSLALADFPLLNASVDDACENITYHDTHNISVAMDTSHGLVVPNVKHVEQLSIVGIARELARLAKEAGQSPPRFSQEDLSGGTFALSNIGSIGGTYTSPVVMPPQVAIGALGRIRTAVVPRPDADGSFDAVGFDVGRVLHVSWSADHRVVDGATMANFSNAWKRYVETPSLMLMHLK